MNISIKIGLNPSAIQLAKQEKFNSKVLPVVTIQALKDCNFYCRQDQGGLIASSYSASQPSKGRMVWDTPYAAKVGFTGNPCRDVNPNASLMWWLVGERNCKKNWNAIAQKGMSG
ncbi:MAG: hypothetical protein LUE11_06785 [Clostridia bacterium]|nr:hypothetical protein [Clostridia bacterium]